MQSKKQKYPWLFFMASEIGIKHLVICDSNRVAFASINSCRCCYSLGITDKWLNSPPNNVFPVDEF